MMMGVYVVPLLWIEVVYDHSMGAEDMAQYTEMYMLRIKSL